MRGFFQGNPNSTPGTPQSTRVSAALYEVFDGDVSEENSPRTINFNLSDMDRGRPHGGNIINAGVIRHIRGSYTEINSPTEINIGFGPGQYFGGPPGIPGLGDGYSGNGNANATSQFFNIRQEPSHAQGNEDERASQAHSFVDEAHWVDYRVDHAATPDSYRGNENATHQGQAPPPGRSVLFIGELLSVHNHNDSRSSQEEMDEEDMDTTSSDDESSDSSEDSFDLVEEQELEDEG